MSTVTVPLRQELRPDAREVGLAVINHVLPAYAQGIHHCSLIELAHEAERVEAMPKSPVSRSMRAYVDAERAWRRHLARIGGRA